MVNSSDISSRFWNQSQKGNEEASRETTFIDDIIQKNHIERIIKESLDNVKTVFDGGAGSGRFSIMLAKIGIHVVHYDISTSMIDKAKKIATHEGILDNIEFINGKLEELDKYADKAFDMVISIDSPISYTYPNQNDVIRNLIRIAGKKIILSVSSNLGWIPYLFNPAQKAQYILDKNDNDPFVRWTLENAVPKLPNFRPDMIAVNRIFDTQMMSNLDDMLDKHINGETQWPHTYAFMPDELLAIMSDYGAKNIRLSGPGALSRSIPNEVLVNIMSDKNLKQEFLDFCYRYDKNPWCAGMGKDNIVACADA